MNAETSVGRKMRPEAGALSWDRLNGAQQAAFEKIVDISRRLSMIWIARHKTKGRLRRAERDPLLPIG